MKISASIFSKKNQHDITLQTDNSSKTLAVPPKANGFGSSINGGELLMLALATCFCNDIYREAARRHIDVTGVKVEVSADFGEEGTPGTNISYRPVVTADATAVEIEELISYVDQIAEIHATLRRGTGVTLIR